MEGKGREGEGRGGKGKEGEGRGGKGMEGKGKEGKTSRAHTYVCDQIWCRKYGFQYTVPKVNNLTRRRKISSPNEIHTIAVHTFMKTDALQASCRRRKTRALRLRHVCWCVIHIA